MSQLFNKTSSSANEMAEIWDDTALIRMYEESISSAYKSVAPAANKKATAGAGTGKKKSSKWSVGGRCAAPYNEEDGEDPLWYPATITHIDVSSGTAEVCFDGYEGAETVSLEELYPEEDLDGGHQQEQEEEEEEQSGTGEEGMEVSFHRQQSHHSHQSAPFSSSTSAQTPSSSRKRTNGGKTGGGSGGRTGGNGGGFRAPIPSLAPPPPPSFAAIPRASEDDALSSMLMSWYMSGYHTGYYQAMQDLKAGKK